MVEATPEFIHQISRTTIKPSQLPDPTTPDLIHLTPWDLSMLSLNYVECGLLFSKPYHHPQFINHLQTSLSETLFHYYPLSGRLITEKLQDNSCTISIDCRKLEGVDFIHATTEKLTVDDIVAQNKDVPSFIKYFFPSNGMVNYDGCTNPLLMVQAVELVDGIFLACSMNHVVADGSSFWNFMNAWAQICRCKQGQLHHCLLRHLPCHDRWFVDGAVLLLPIKLPFSNPDQFIDQYTPPKNLRTKIFHFPSHSIFKLKSICNITGEQQISSFQALSSLVWRSITRARNLQPNRKTYCRIASNDRAKLVPSLTMDHFGNYVSMIGASSSVKDLLSNDIAYSAKLLHKRITEHGDDEIQNWTREWVNNPILLSPCKINPSNVSVLSSPKFDVYGCDFGWGPPVGLRTGCTYCADGVVAAHPGRVKGSVDLEVCLLPETMQALECDHEFISFIDIQKMI